MPDSFVDFISVEDSLCVSFIWYFLDLATQIGDTKFEFCKIKAKKFHKKTFCHWFFVRICCSFLAVLGIMKCCQIYSYIMWKRFGLSYTLHWGLTVTFIPRNVSKIIATTFWLVIKILISFSFLATKDFNRLNVTVVANVVSEYIINFISEYRCCVWKYYKRDTFCIVSTFDFFEESSGRLLGCSTMFCSTIIWI